MKRAYSVLFILLWGLSLHAQDVMSIVDTLEFKLFPYQVKQIGEFRHRLNGEIDVFNQTDSLNELRNIASLVNYDYAKNNYEIVSQFVEDIAMDSLSIDFFDSRWYAEAICGGKLGKESVKFSLFLQVDTIIPKFHTWALIGAKGDCFNLNSEKKNDGLIIAPTNNDVNFSKLSHITTTEHRNIKVFASTQCHVDQLSVFMSLVYTGLLHVDDVHKVIYHFENITGYNFDVEYFNRIETTNSGWLISKIEKVAQ